MNATKSLFGALVLSLILVSASCKDKSKDDAPAPAETAKPPATKPTQAPPTPPERKCTPATNNRVPCSNSTRTSPFSCVRYTKECAVEVQIASGAEFVRLKSVNGISVDALVDAAKRGCRGGVRT